MNLKRIFKESFYGNEMVKNAILEFTYAQSKPSEIESIINKLKELLANIDVQYATHYANINKVVVVCPQDKCEDVKSLAKSVGLTLQHELKPDPNESNKL